MRAKASLLSRADRELLDTSRYPPPAPPLYRRRFGRLVDRSAASNGICTVCAWRPRTPTSVLVRDCRPLIAVYRQRARSTVSSTWSSTDSTPADYIGSVRQRATMLSLFESIAYIPKFYYGALVGIGFCIYYLCEVVKVSDESGK